MADSSAKNDLGRRERDETPAESAATNILHPTKRIKSDSFYKVEVFEPPMDGEMICAATPTCHKKLLTQANWEKHKRQHNFPPTTNVQCFCGIFFTDVGLVMHQNKFDCVAIHASFLDFQQRVTPTAHQSTATRSNDQGTADTEFPASGFIGGQNGEGHSVVDVDQLHDTPIPPVISLEDLDSMLRMNPTRSAQLYTSGGQPIYVTDLRRILSTAPDARAWLNDTIIMSYFGSISSGNHVPFGPPHIRLSSTPQFPMARFIALTLPECVSMKAFEKAVKQKIGTRGVVQELRRLEYIFVILGGEGGHWALGVIGLHENLPTYSVVESMNFERDVYYKEMEDFISNTLAAVIGSTTWVRKSVVSAQQTNRIDCGPILLRNAELILQRRPLQHCEYTDMKQMRRHIAETIHRQRDKPDNAHQKAYPDDDVVMGEAADEGNNHIL